MLILAPIALGLAQLGGSGCEKSDSADSGADNPRGDGKGDGKIIATPEDHAKRAFGNWMSDNAIDIGLKMKTPVYAVADGRVERTSGKEHDPGNGNPAGATVYLDIEDGQKVAYMHNWENKVKAGDRVKKGDVIGLSGRANGVEHLHLGVLKGNPEKYFEAVISGSGEAPDAGSAEECGSEKGGEGGEVSGDIQELAKQMLENKNITYWTNNGANTRDVVKDLAAGKKGSTTCANANGKKSDVNPKILKFILEVAKKDKIMVNALTDKCHSNGSQHYKGQAVDLDLQSAPLSVLNPAAKKNGGSKNSEGSHHHYDF